MWSWWAFDIFTLMASYMSEDVIAAQTVLRNIALLFFMIPVGIAVSTGVLVGNNIGSQQVEAAKFYAKMCFLTAFLWSIASVISVFGLRN